MNQTYCNSLTEYSRRKTREVYIGDVPLGGDNPIRVQSMTTVDTMDTEGSVQPGPRQKQNKTSQDLLMQYTKYRSMRLQ